MQGSWSFQGQISSLQTANINLRKEKTELQTELTELKAKNDAMEHEMITTRNKFIEEVKRVEGQRREINSKLQESEYRLSKQIELHGDFDLINKEN